MSLVIERTWVSKGGRIVKKTVDFFPSEGHNEPLPDEGGKENETALGSGSTSFDEAFGMRNGRDLGRLFPLVLLSIVTGLAATADADEPPRPLSKDLTFRPTVIVLR